MQLQFLSHLPQLLSSYDEPNIRSSSLGGLDGGGEEGASDESKEASGVPFPFFLFFG